MLYHSHCNLTNNTFPAALLPSKACDYQPHSPTVKSSNDRLLVKVKRFRENLFEIKTASTRAAGRDQQLSVVKPTC